MGASSVPVRWPIIVAAIAVLATAAATSADPPTRLEMNITNNAAGFSSGEPEIAINPSDPDNLFIAYATFPVPVPPGNVGDAPEDSCGGFVSMDRGETWQLSPLPLPQQTDWTFSRCEDGLAAFGPDGTLYAGGDAATESMLVGVPPCPPGSAPFGPVCIRVLGNDPFARSTDGGLTWSALPHPMGSPEWCPTCQFAPGSGDPHDVFDRPWIAVDQSTGVVYFSARGILPPNQRFATASTDKGDTFGLIYAIDSPTHPQGGSTSNIAAAKGFLAEAYVALPAPGGCTETCLIFETSTDFGATWDRHVVPLVDPASTPRAFLAAHAGDDPDDMPHFALTVLDSTGTINQVYTTRDLGQTWQGPALVTETATDRHFKQWLSYGPTGELVLMWRTWHGTPNDPATPYDVWAAVGRQRGAHGPIFSAPRRVSSADSPFGGSGDDFSFVTADRQFVHVGWGDSRSGVTDVWYSRMRRVDFFPF